MTTPYTVSLAPGASPMDFNLARILRRNLTGSANTVNLSKLPRRIMISDLPSKRALSLLIDPAAGIAISSATSTHKPTLEGNFDPFSGLPPTFRLRGGWRQPFLAQRLRALLAPNLEPWPLAAKKFYEMDGQGLTDDLRIHHECIGGGERHTFGEGNNEVSILAKADTLAYLYNGYAMLIDEILKGRVQCLGSMQSIALITDATIHQWMDQT